MAKHRSAPACLCGSPMRLRYPGNDPENGPARPVCSKGHMICNECGKLIEPSPHSEPIDSICDSCAERLDPWGPNNDPHYHETLRDMNARSSYKTRRRARRHRVAR